MLRSLKDSSVREVEDIRRELTTNEVVFLRPINGIGKHFLAYFFGREIFKLSFADILRMYNEHMEEAAPASEDDFYSFVCAQYLDLKSSPQDALLKHYRKTSEDLREVSTRISDYEKEVVRLSAVEQKTEDEEYSLKIYSHYIGLNKEVREDLIDFMTSRRIRDFAVSECENHWGLSMPLLFGRVPYNYSWYPRRYKIESLSPLGSKFAELELQEYYDIRRLYTTDKRAFESRMNSFIRDHNIVDRIQNKLSQHHRLAERKKLLDDTIDAYKTGKKELFCSVIPVQVEGIFYDYCVELGFEEQTLHRKSLGGKLNLVVSREKEFPRYEYYTFCFPRVRNKVAHGHIISSNVDYWADFLLLDLLDVVEMMESSTLPVNRMVKLIRMVSADLDNVKALTRYAIIDQGDIKIPPFYNLTTEVALLKEKLFEQPVWDFFRKLADERDEMLRRGILIIAQRFKEKGVNEAWCKELIAKLAPQKLPEFDEDDFLDKLSAFQN